MTYRIRRRIWATVIGALVAANLLLSAAPSQADANVRLECDVTAVSEVIAR
jgi:hypothetical protein